MSGLLRRWREWRDAREEYRASVEEMRFHVEQETERNLRNGMSPREARRAALKAFGGIDRFSEAAHDERPGTRWSDFRMSWLDWKLGSRMLAKYPGMSVISVITLAAAIGLGVGWFEMTMLVYDPRLPLEDGDRIVRIEQWDARTLVPEPRMTHELTQWRDRLASVEELGAHRTVERNLLLPGRAPQIVRVAEMSPAGFDVARVPPLLGRRLIAADEVPGSDDVVVIGYDAWQRYFDADRTVIGRDVQLGRTRATVVGVMPEGFRFPANHEFWIPLRVTDAEPLAGAAISVFGRLRTGASMESAGAELAAWGARMAQRSPATHEHLQPQVLPFAGSREPADASELLLFNLGAWLILIVACANVAALMFARTALRESEIVVRNALGASRGRVMGQLFAEALVLTSVSAVVGVLGARAAIAFAIDLTAARHTPLPFWMDANLEPRTILYAAVLAVAGAGMVALLPALRATGRHVRSGLSRIGSGGTSMRFGGAWSAIIVMQVALSVLCLPFGMAAALEAWHDTRQRAAFPAVDYLTFRPVVDAESGTAGAVSAEQAAAVLEELSRRLLEEPDVAAVTVTSALPGLYHPLMRVEAQRGSGTPFLVPANTEGQRVRVGGAGPGFFATFQLPMITGREFRDGDVGAEHGVVVINESMARNLGGNPVGTRIRFAAADGEEPGPWQEVIGVVRNFGLTPTDRGEADYMWTPVSATEAAFMVLRVNGGADAFGQGLRTLALQVDPSLRLHDVRSLHAAIRQEDQGTISMVLIGIGIVLLVVALSAASLYALMSVAVALRTREIGIRVAIGASSRAVLASLFRRVATQVGIGIVVGNIIVAVLLNFMLQDIRPAVVLPPMAAASLVMLLVGLGACLVPARRALRIHPTEAFKEAR
ncbi:MAG TPA: ABC transporter permease [Longimicrobiales bacterium]|nr:ABC transporter permease [Longimicrobiales bacterium]